MYTTQIQKWGNSQGVRVPKFMLESLNINESDSVEIDVERDCIVIKKKPMKVVEHQTLEKRLESFYGKSIEDIKPEEVEQDSEYNWGEPTGAEIW